MTRHLLTCILILLSVASCTKSEKASNTDNTDIVNDSNQSDYIKYSKGLNIQPSDGFTLVDIFDPANKGSQIWQYALVPRGTSPKQIPDGYQVIETPVQKVIVMTTLQLSNFIKLDAVDKVVGMPSTRFLFNEQMRSQLASGQTRHIGIEGNFDTELIMSLQPDIILVSPYKRGGYEMLQSVGVPLVSFLGYKELTPLGQAEWIKFVALLLGIENSANSLFDGIEKRYNELKALITPDLARPTVLSGELHGGHWYVVGGQSYLAHQFEDAGADYFMRNDKESGGFYVDFETVYSQGANADYWRIVNNYPGTYDYDVLAKTDVRYKDFRAFKERRVIYCNLNERPFYELSPVEPDAVLADLIKVFHPQLLPNHQPVFYDVLK